MAGAVGVDEKAARPREIPANTGSESNAKEASQAAASHDRALVARQFPPGPRHVPLRSCLRLES